MIPCPCCSGKGRLEIRSKATGGVWQEVDCPECKGTGVSDIKTLKDPVTGKKVTFSIKALAKAFAKKGKKC